MSTIVIAASEAKAKFSELLERVRKGESFSITHHGREAAKLVPTGHDLKGVQAAIAKLRANRSILNPPGMPKLTIKDLVNEGRR